MLSFRIGAPAERIRATGRGLLIPLGAEPACINDTLADLAAQVRAGSRLHATQRPDARGGNRLRGTHLTGASARLATAACLRATSAPYDA